ncbi:MAG TPA: hypothetical protein DSN98_07805 [Thermoplasmata archaeon]|jgi:hypothetical protein|nr:MAG TPA: hypothetical protein DSN98_07805 [Thermoplasmata archaeon]
MAIGLFNRQSAFFMVDVPSFEGKNSPILDRDIISFDIDEELGKILSGTLSLYDPNNYYSRVLRQGTRLTLGWGYKDPDTNPRTVLMKTNFAELKGRGLRQNVHGHVTSPSGSGSATGEQVYNVSFYGTESRSNNTPEIFRRGKKADVISSVLSKLGVLVVNQYIDFVRGKEPITEYTQPIQWETDFRFLLRMAFEWRAAFKIGQDTRGTLIGVFSDYSSPQMEAYSKRCSNAIGGSYVTVNYKGNPCNVNSYTWSLKTGLDGSGDNVRIQMVNGQPQFFRYRAETQTVETWKLNPDKIKNEVKRRPSTSEKVAVGIEWMKKTKFSEVSWAFDKCAETTAPQGLGYEMNLQMLGDPLFTPGIRIEFGAYASDVGGGFPDFCYPVKGKEKIRWWISKVKHTIDSKGYNMNVDVQDAFLINGGVMVS